MVRQQARALASNTSRKTPGPVRGRIRPATRTRCHRLVAIVCDAHAAAHEHADEEVYLPVVNSPRMGVCGYTG